MKDFFFTLFPNIWNSFKGRNILFHLIAIITTYLILVSGFDWCYFVKTQNEIIRNLSFSAVVLGGLVPIVIPLTMLALGKLRKDPILTLKAWMFGQAALLGSIISSFYKALTGRLPPEAGNTITDISHGFQIGILKNGIFWGWPSSHTTIAFSMAFAFIYMYGEKKLFKYLALIYAFYIGIGISTTIHWFSEFSAGAIIGSVIGVAVGKSYLVLRNRKNNLNVIV